MTLTWYGYIGIIASVLIAIFTLPQLISLIKTRNTVYINIPMYAIYLVGCYLFFVGGFIMLCNKDLEKIARLSSALPLLIAQGICGIISTTIFVWKLKNYIRAKRNNMTEVKYCELLKHHRDDYKDKLKQLAQPSKKHIDKGEQ